MQDQIMAALRLTKKIESQKKVIEQFVKEGNRVGEQRAKRTLKDLEQQLRKIVE